MLVRELRARPKPWHEYAAPLRNRWLVCFHGPEWLLQWTAYYLSRWAFLEVLEYLGVLSVLVAVIFYFSEAGDRTKQKHYQAWQVINTAQGKGGSGGRIEALQELNMDGVPLVGVRRSDQSQAQQCGSAPRGPTGNPLAADRGHRRGQRLRRAQRSRGFSRVGPRAQSGFRPR
jgi:hypothetical protein